MKITDIEIIPIHPRMAPRIAGYLSHFPTSNLRMRTIARVRTNNGLVGYGDVRGRPPDLASVKPLIGRDPFDFSYNDLRLDVAGALYDVMGKYLELPAYKLMGQKVRDSVSVAAWTPIASPEKLREEVLRATAEGYSILKMHTCAYYDVFAQNRAVEEVAPPGFKMHYDFNHNRTLVSSWPIMRELEKSPVVGYIEDPLRTNDIDGWRRLREKSGLPLIMHNPPLGGGQEVIRGCADAYLVPGPVGTVLRSGCAYAAANIPVLLQFTGGALTKALALHVAAVLPTATMHSVCLDDQYEEDVTRERIPVIEGCSPVPEGPGLGIEVDEDALARLAAEPASDITRHVAVLRLAGGHKIYYPSLTAVNVQRLTGREEGTIRGLELELWDDDGSIEFARVHDRLQASGPFVD
jgi:L-alanine-DL-glutamate epimerase-like enolase superfamily enzyme